MEITFSPIENKIVQLFSRDHFAEGMELFNSSFTAEKPPSYDFVARCFTELNRLGRNPEAFEFMTRVSTLIQRHPEINRMLEMARRIHYDTLIVQANAVMDTARQKLQVFAETLQGADALHRDRIEKENRKALEDLYRQALAIFQQAHEVSPRALGALTGMFRCHKELRNQKEADELSALIDEVYKEAPGTQPGAEGEGGPASQPAEDKADLPPMPEASDIKSVLADLEIEMRRIKAMFEENRTTEALAALDILLLGNPQFIPGLLLKAKVLTARRQFKPAQRLIEEAVKIDGRNPQVEEARIEFLEHKFKLLVAGASEFLQQGLRLGSTLGRSFFEQALSCLNQALEICPTDVNLLDQRYTCLIYLERMEEAREARKALYMVAPQYIATFERENQSSLCFLAGFAYQGDPEALEDFRTLRREWFTPTTAGRTFLAWYTRLSPQWVAAARRIGLSPTLPRLCLAPLRLLAACLNRQRRRHCRRSPRMR
ncbi:MAG: hypothetical protein OZSIB_1331 [Candidatus Ozemobacter sibiricus]|uniref:Tetratricopeptide repeat protein n=1 Tax=Candidatus Ozemobacter sibiricus TaxID=2268124 RepID=A0A367ZLH0_9BACT|nr:MAG: hypothetical protein OZSIB_1331 [Candidatus Ozemobacter sibiricus]